jgi:hypothetical protein
MQPSLNMDREGTGSPEQSRKYNELAEQLEEHVEKMAAAYDALIVAFHAILLE